LIKKSALKDFELTQENMLKISYLQLKSLKEEKGRVKERIRLLEGSLHMGCDEAYGALTELLRENFDSLSHHDRMYVLNIIENSKNVGCIEPLIEILERFESMEPKSRYLYEQIGKIIKILGKSKRRWLVYILTKYKNSSSRLIRDETNNAISELMGSCEEV
jgi:hypothetical protein